VDISTLEQNYRQLDNLCSEAIRVANAYDLNTETKQQIDRLIEILEETHKDVKNIGINSYSIPNGFNLTMFSRFIDHVREISNYKINSQIKNDQKTDIAINELYEAINVFSNNHFVNSLVNSCHHSIQNIKNSVLKIQNSANNIDSSADAIIKFVNDQRQQYGDFSSHIAGVIGEDVNDSARKLIRINDEMSKEFISKNLDIQHASSIANTSHDINSIINSLNKIVKNEKVSAADMIDNINAQMLQAAKTSNNITKSPINTMEDALKAYQRMHQIQDEHDKLLIRRNTTAELSENVNPNNLQDDTFNTIQNSLETINVIVSDKINDHQAEIKDSTKKENLKSNENLSVQLAKMFAGFVKPMTNEFSSVRNSREILQENTLRKIPFVQQQNRLVSQGYQEIENESFVRSLISPSFIQDQQSFLSQISNHSSADAFIKSISTTVVNDSSMVLRRSMSLVDNEYKKMTTKEKENYDKIQKDLQTQIANTVNLINSLEILNSDSEYLKQLKSINAELVDRERAMSKAKSQENKESLGDKIMSGVSGWWGMFNSALAMMGLGGIISLSKLLSDTKNADVSSGKLMQQAALADQMLGANIAENDNYNRIYRMGARFQHLTAGQIQLAAPTQFYQSLARQIGGRYNSNPEKNREDLSQFTYNLFAMKEANDLDNNDFNQLIKYYYKDSQQDVNQTSSKIANIIEQAKILGIPVKLYLNQASSLAVKSYELGMSADDATEMMFNLVKRGMLIEDAHGLVIKSAQVAQRFGQNKSQVAYFGALSGMGYDLYANMTRGRIFMDRNGKPVENFREMMGKAMMSKYGRYDDFFGSSDSNLSLAYFGRLLKEDGYSEKEVSMMMSMKKEGKYDEIEEILLGKNDKKFKQRKELSDSISEATKALSNMGQQTAITQQIMADRQANIMRLAELWKENFSPLIGKTVSFIDNLLEKLPGKIASFIKTIRDLANDPNAAGFIKMFGDNPLLTIGGSITALGMTYGLGKYALGKASGLITNSILNGLQKTFKTNPSISSPKNIPNSLPGSMKTFGKIAGTAGLVALGVSLIPQAIDYFSKDRQLIDDKEKLNKNINGFESLSTFMSSGKAKIRLMNFDGSFIEMEDDEEEQNVLDTTSKVALGIAGLLLTKKGISMFFKNGQFKQLTPTYISQKMTAKEMKNVQRFKTNLRNNFANAWKYIKPSNILHPSQFSLKRFQKNLRRVPRSIRNIANVYLEAKNIPQAYRTQFLKKFGTETPKIKSFRDYLKVGSSILGGTKSTILQEIKNYQSIHSTSSAVFSNMKNFAKNWWGMTLFFEGAGEISDALSGNQRSAGERLERIAIGTGSSLGGAAIGAAIGQALIPIPGIGALAGSMIGGYAGNQFGNFLKDKMGIGEKMDEATRNWVATMNETSLIRDIDIMKVLQSETDQGEILRKYLKDNGLDLTALNETQKNILKEIVEQNKRQHATLGQMLSDIALKRRQITSEFGFGQGNLHKYMSDNSVLAKFYQDYAANYDENHEYNRLYTHLSNYYYHPNAGSDDKKYWENERDQMRNLSGKKDDFAQRIKRNYVEMLKQDGRYNAIALAIMSEKGQYIDDSSDIDSLNVDDEEVADFALKTISTHDTVNLWQHIAEVIKEQPDVYKDLQKYIIDKYGTPSQSSSVDAGNIPMWLQHDERWGDMAPNGGSSMSAIGCFATSAAMMRAIYTGEMIDPGEFLRRGYWDSEEWYSAIHASQYDPSSYEEAVNLVRKTLKSGKPMLAYHSGYDAVHPSYSVGHAVVYIGYNADGTIRVHDPAKGVINLTEQELLANAGQGSGSYGFAHNVGFYIPDIDPAVRIGGSFYSAEPQSETSKSSNGIPALEELKTKNPQYYQWVMKYSHEYGVDPYLAAAIMKAENGLEWGSNSSAGAIGAMQLMPSTAAGLGVNPYDEQDNIKGGIKYLGQLGKAWHGHAGAIAAAYNSGGGEQTGVAEYFSTGDLSKIAYEETRKYVPKVLSYMKGGGSFSNQTLNHQAPPKLQTVKEQIENADAMMKRIASRNGNSRAIATGHLINDMFVDPNAESLEEKMNRIKKQHRITYQKEHKKSKEQRQKAHRDQVEKLDEEIRKRQEELQQEQDNLIEQQKAQKQAEKENIGNIQIFGIMKKDHNGEQISPEKMLEEIYKILCSNKWTSDMQYVEAE